MWKFRQDDLDTIFTVINQGLMKKPYWVEYHGHIRGRHTCMERREVRAVGPYEAGIPRGACADDATNDG
ncbi:MAG: hypothetical protein ACTTKT_04275 [Prevotella veroralis]